MHLPTHDVFSIEPDAGIVNFYQTKVIDSPCCHACFADRVQDTLMAHVDRSEVCSTTPLVSISYVCDLLCNMTLTSILITLVDLDVPPYFS